MSSKNKLHTGVHGNLLNKYIRALVDKGYKVAIIDQIETAREAMYRNIEEK